MLRKVLAMTVALALSAGLFTGCWRSEDGASSSASHSSSQSHSASSPQSHSASGSSSAGGAVSDAVSDAGEAVSDAMSGAAGAASDMTKGDASSSAPSEADGSSSGSRAAPAAAGAEDGAWMLRLVNAANPLPEDFSVRTANIAGYENRPFDMRAADRLEAMLRDAENAGCKLYLVSGYRTVSRQAALFKRKVETFMAEGFSQQEAERQAAIEAAEKSKGETFTTESGNQATVEAPEAEEPAPDEGETNNGSNGNGGATSTGGVDWNVDRETFISTWSARIDAYLAGSPLAGQGGTFAEAAWEYGCDPRFSPAIAMVESSLGRNCFLPHNAWGWGSSSWGSWEEAIWDHVRGLATIYGGQLTYAGAQMYCPPNADHWYTSVLANMERI